MFCLVEGAQSVPKNLTLQGHELEDVDKARDRFQVGARRFFEAAANGASHQNRERTPAEHRMQLPALFIVSVAADATLGRSEDLSH